MACSLLALNKGWGRPTTRRAEDSCSQICLLRPGRVARCTTALHWRLRAPLARSRPAVPTRWRASAGSASRRSAATLLRPRPGPSRRQNRAPSSKPDQPQPAENSKPSSVAQGARASIPSAGNSCCHLHGGLTQHPRSDPGPSPAPRESAPARFLPAAGRRGNRRSPWADHTLWHRH